MQKPQGTKEWHEAACCGWTQLVKFLLSIGAEVDLMDDHVNNRGETALIKAAASGHTPVAELLLANGAEVNAKDRDVSDLA